jgi:hypothetical protein
MGSLAVRDQLERGFARLESSPVASALAGLRANEARYFKNKYDHDFTVEPTSEARETVDWVHRILKEERDVVISARPLEATAFQVENIARLSAINAAVATAKARRRIGSTSGTPERFRLASSSARSRRPWYGPRLIAPA